MSSGADAGTDYNSIADRIYIEGWALALTFAAVERWLSGEHVASIGCAIMSAICQFVVIRWATWIKTHPDNRLLRSLNGVATNAGWWVATLMVFLGYLALSPYMQGYWPKGPSAEEIATAVVKALPQSSSTGHPQEKLALWPGQATFGNLTIPIEDRILGQPTIEWDGKGPIIFHAGVSHPIEKMAIYLDWGPLGPNANYVLSNGLMGSPRVEIGFIERLATGQMLNVTIGGVTSAENGQQQMLQWGEAHYNNPKVGISAAGYVARVAIIRKDGKEEQYPFIIVPRTLTTPPDDNQHGSLCTG